MILGYFNPRPAYSEPTVHLQVIVSCYRASGFFLKYFFIQGSLCKTVLLSHAGVIGRLKFLGVSYLLRGQPSWGLNHDQIPWFFKLSLYNSICMQIS
ncbi:hypothetical protein SAMN05443144_111130 [Fodinibius roseus]|uniref:Uncharacterized protein n=1 Tax=Fodinibius roseus TaxID=1194090 RepID=A0A1M5DIT1_9BACT|nr:hypothetical protein SAMN05443144_111130 [Fodinibius roseus]